MQVCVPAVSLAIQLPAWPGKAILRKEAKVREKIEHKLSWESDLVNCSSVAFNRFHPQQVWVALRPDGQQIKNTSSGT